MEVSYSGQVIANRFEVSASIGEGACGTVWMAHDRVLGIHVAVKVLRDAMRRDPKRLAAFEREALVCLRMLSPNIVRVLAFGAEADELPFIAYELLPGETLEQRLGRAPKLTIDEVENAVVQIARGLGRAHTLGVVHRDIKPSNVFLTKDDREKSLAKVLDFGIATLRGKRDTQGNDVYGTLEYIAPELVFQTHEPDARADLYSLTALAYECLTGRPPFRVASVPELIARLARGPSSPDSVAPIVGAAAAVALDDFFERGLSKDPSERFQSARELAEELHRVIKAAKVANPALVVVRPSMMSLPAVEMPTGDSASKVAVAPKPPPMRPRAQSFVFGIEDEIDMTNGGAPSSGRGRDPRRE